VPNEFQIGHAAPRSSTPKIGKAPAIDGPEQPLEIHASPPGTKRLSKKGQFLLLGGASAVASAILIGIMISGKSGKQCRTEKANVCGRCAGSSCALQREC
jgi:hypothetical protein